MHEPAGHHRVIPGHPFHTILSYNRPYWRAYLAGGLCALVFVSIQLAMPLVIRWVVARFEDGTMSVRHLFHYFVGLLIIAIVTGFARYWERVLIIGASRKCEYDLRNDFFSHVQTLSQDFFHRIKTGDIMARSLNDLNFVRMFIGPGIMGTIDILRVPFTLGLMIYLSGRLTLLSLAPLPLVSLMVYGFVMYMHRQSQKVQEQFSVLTSRVQENLAGARVVKAYGIAGRESAVFGKDARTYLRENLKLAAVMSLAHPLIGFVIALMVLLVIWRGGGMVIDGTLQLDDLTGFIVCMLMLVWPLAEFGWVLTLYQRGAVGMNRMGEIFAETPAIRDSEQTRPDFAVSQGAVRFDHVHFAYDGIEVLNDIQAGMDAGQTVAIVGPTGSGKSTIVSLLTREYDATAGTVLIDGHDIRRIPIRALRGAIGYVPQDTFLFSDTIRANITFGRPDATREKIDRACEVAQFAGTVADLPGGYDTLLGERGVNLSGGQKQRLAIARAIVCDPKILILDDALSSVDTETEERILQRLNEVMKTRTSIIISHRVSTVRHADAIIVIDEGRIVERGTHGGLIAANGLYATMHERQLLEQKLEET